MRVVKLELNSSTEKRPMDFDVRVERRMGVSGAYKVENSFAVTSGQPEASRTLLLDDDARIVIEPRGSTTEVVYDKAQGAAMPREAFETQPTEDEKIEIEAARQKELEEREGRGRQIDREAAMRQEILDAETAAKKRGETPSNPGMPQVPSKPPVATPKPAAVAPKPTSQSMQQGVRPGATTAPGVPQRPATPGTISSKAADAADEGK